VAGRKWLIDLHHIRNGAEQSTDGLAHLPAPDIMPPALVQRSGKWIAADRTSR
jgi:hypothetical protein